MWGGLGQQGWNGILKKYGVDCENNCAVPIQILPSSI